MRRSTDGDMNPLVKVAVALIIGMTLGRYGATAVPLWSWSAMAALCLAIVLFSGKGDCRAAGHCFWLWLR